MPTRRVLRRSLIGAAVVLAVLLVVATATGVALVRRPFPVTEGQVSLPGLGGEVSVQRDAHGVPQIYADNPDDLFRAQGYVQAQDRFFEMDLRRHVAAGRLSELVGPDAQALASDKLARTLGWRQVAQAELEQAAPSTRRYLEAYARGVNDYLRGRSAAELSLNYPLLGVSHPMRGIEPWTPLDSLTWFKALAWDLRGGYEDEIDRALAFGVVRDVSRVDQLYPAYPYGRHTPVLPDGGKNGAGATTGGSSDGTAGAGADGNGADGNGAGDNGADVPGGASPSASPSAARTAAADTEAEAASLRSTLGGTSRKASPTPTRPAATRTSGRTAAQTAPRADTGTPMAAPATGEMAKVLAGPAQQVMARTRQALAAVPAGAVGGSGDGVGSNSWVVSGRFTASGKPLLANDPHLGPSLPAVWYQMGLHCRTVSSTCPFDVSGFTLSGIPGVLMGHNARISWGLGNLGADTTDLYLERVSENRVVRDGQEQALTLREETIEVAGASSVTITVRTGPHGPLVSDVAPDPDAGVRSPGARGGAGHGDGYAVALSWTALTPGHDLDAVLAVNVAQNFDAFRKAALLMDAPAQGLVYADVDGHIGYQAAGRVPLRPRVTSPAGNRADAVPTDGTWPLPGWTSAYDWKSSVATSDLPWTLDPAEGFVVAANQAVTPAGGKISLGHDFDYGYRSERIRELLTADISRGTKLGVNDMVAIQNDTANGMAAQLVPLLKQVKISDPFYADAVHLLDGWTGDQPVESPAAAFFNAVWASLLELTFNDELPEGSRPDGGSRWFEVVRNLLGDSNDTWWDNRSTPSVLETRDEILRQSVIQARNRLTRSIGKDPKTWTWGRLHQVKLRSAPIGTDDGIIASLTRALLNEGPVAVAGGSSAVDALSWNAASGTFDVAWAPSARMVVDLGDLNRSRWINQPGQSGHPGDDHYTDQLDAWVDGRTYSWPWSREAVRSATKHTLTLRPRG